MKWKRVCIIALAIVCIVSVATVAYKLHAPTRIEKLEDGRVGVETTVTSTVDLKTFTFTCSAVFQVEKDAGDGAYYIESVTSEFLERKRVPNEYTFVPQGDIEVICEKEGKSYLVQRTLQVKRSGNPVSVITVGARFTIDNETGLLSAEAMVA